MSSVILVNGTVTSARGKDIALLSHDVHRIVDHDLVGVRVRAELLRTRHGHVHLDIVRVQARRAENGRVPLDYTNNLGTIAMHKLGEVVADVTEALHDNLLAFDSFAQVSALTELIILEQFLENVVTAETGGFRTARDTTLRKQLAGGTTHSINLRFTVQIFIRVHNPCHDLLVGSHVRAEAVVLGTDETLLGELHSVLASDTLQLTIGVFSRVESDSTLGTAEWDVSNHQFERHQRGERDGFLQRHVRGVTSATLDRHEMMLVLRSVAGESLNDTVVTADRNLEPKSMVASHQVVQQVGLDVDLRGRLICEHLNLFKESWLFLVVVILTMMVEAFRQIADFFFALQGLGIGRM